MTPLELRIVAEALSERERREWQRFAWLGAIFINCFSKKKVRPQDLVPEAFERERRRVTKEEAKRELEDLKKRLRIKQ
jgi:hypothetical protein